MPVVNAKKCSADWQTGIGISRRGLRRVPYLVCAWQVCRTYVATRQLLKNKRTKHCCFELNAWLKTCRAENSKISSNLVLFSDSMTIPAFETLLLAGRHQSASHFSHDSHARTWIKPQHGEERRQKKKATPATAWLTTTSARWCHSSLAKLVLGKYSCWGSTALLLARLHACNQARALAAWSYSATCNQTGGLTMHSC